jgi:hypothetical protein
MDGQGGYAVSAALLQQHSWPRGLGWLPQLLQPHWSGTDRRWSAFASVAFFFCTPHVNWPWQCAVSQIFGWHKYVRFAPGPACTLKKKLSVTVLAGAVCCCSIWQDNGQAASRDTRMKENFLSCPPAPQASSLILASALPMIEAAARPALTADEAHHRGGRAAACGSHWPLTGSHGWSRRGSKD